MITPQQLVKLLFLTLVALVMVTGCADTPHLEILNAKASDLAFSPDGKRLYAVTPEGVCYWELPSCTPMPPVTTDKTMAMAISPDGARMAVATTGQIEIRRLPDNTTEHILISSCDHCSAVIFSADGSLLAAGYAYGSATDRQGGATLGLNPVFVWETQSGRLLRRFDQATEPVHDLTFSADGQRIFAASETTIDNYSHAQWLALDIVSGEEVGRFTGAKGFAIGVAASPDGKRLYACDSDGRILCWDLATGCEVKRFAGTHSICWKFRLSPDGRIAAVATGDDMGLIPFMIPQPTFPHETQVAIYDTQTGSLIRKLHHRSPVTGLAISRDASLIAGAAASIRIWAWNGSPPHRDSGRQ